MPPLVSILIPAYNAERWIADTIRSALAQTWPRKEIIIVDDGSVDRTLDIAQRFGAPNVSVITQSNQGASAARSKAYDACQGDYIQWLDADDLLAPDKIERQMDVVSQCSSNRTLFSAAWGYFMYRPSKTKFVPSALWHDLSPLEWLLRKWENNLHMQTANWLMNRALTEAAGPWDTRLSVDDDGEYLLRIIAASDGIRFIPASKVYYRITTPNRLSYIGGSKPKVDAQFFAMKLQITRLRSIQDDDRVRRACVNYLQTWYPNFYPNHTEIVHEARQLAESLGGRLGPPRLSLKYSWIQRLFGWEAAKRSQCTYNKAKSCVLRTWDRTLSQLEKQQPVFRAKVCSLSDDSSELCHAVQRKQARPSDAALE